MTTVRPAALETPSDLDSKATERVAEALNAALADTFALYFKTKNFHWHISGPSFRDYHLLLDEQAGQILAATDAIAERLRKTGNTTLRSIGDVARRQTLADNDADFVAPRAMLAELRADNLRLADSFRSVKGLADAARDNATSGMTDTWTEEAERRAWFLHEAGRTS